MTDTIVERARQAEPVKCAHAHPPYSASFLKILEDGDRLRVMQTSLGKKKLPRFWTVWLEDLILRRTRPEQQFHVSIDNRHVLIGADGDITREGFRQTVKQLVAEVFPRQWLPLMPTTNFRSEAGMVRTYGWRQRYPEGTLDLQHLQKFLPKGADLSVDEYDDTVKLVYSGDLPDSQHVKLQVEYFACLSFIPPQPSAEREEKDEQPKPTQLKLSITLEGDEVDQFQRLAGTDDLHYQRAIAKSLVLGAGEVVVPADVADDIRVLLKVARLEMNQDVADRLSYTREQLTTPEVTQVVRRWAGTYRSLLNDLEQGLETPDDQQYLWVGISVVTTDMLDLIRSLIGRALHH